jgi:hypothetical protein
MQDSSAQKQLLFVEQYPLYSTEASKGVHQCQDISAFEDFIVHFVELFVAASAEHEVEI